MGVLKLFFVKRKLNVNYITIHHIIKLAYHNLRANREQIQFKSLWFGSVLNYLWALSEPTIMIEAIHFIKLAENTNHVKNLVWTSYNWVDMILKYINKFERKKCANILFQRAISSPLVLVLRSLPSSHRYPTKPFAIICKLILIFISNPFSTFTWTKVFRERGTTESEEREASIQFRKTGGGPKIRTQKP